MAFQLKQLVPCLLLLSIISFSHISFSHAKVKPCKCLDSGQDQVRRSHTYNAFNDDGFVEYYSLADKVSLRYMEADHAFLHRLSSISGSEANNTVVLCTINQKISIWDYRPSQQIPVDFDEASFRTTIIYQPLQNQSRSSLAFLILPYYTFEGYNGVEGQLDFTNSTSGSAYIYDSTSVSVVIGALSNNPWSNSDAHPMIINITVDQSSPVAAGASNSNYTVWIDDYDSVGRRLSVYVDLEGKPKPENTIAEVHQSIRNVIPPFVRFGLLSTAAQLLRVGDNGWTVTVSDLPDYFVPDKLSSLSTILYAVFGSIAATAIVSTAVAFYFNSRYRQWHRDQDQLARSMERLPGMPTKVEFANIKKATGNFHETMKLGGGGFGTVYRCTLPAATSKPDQPMDVAIKRFTRDVQSHRFDDFLAEVSIINRLRHKNIVPLIGWSYNKGEPLLVFEFMTNGSLDQHLFPRAGNCSNKGQPRTGVAIRQWATRYQIVRDIATGLHYVHHEYEPLVLHRDIKASNIMLDLSLCARLGDFGLACTVDVDRNSATGVAGTWGYIAPEYAVCGKATRQTDIYALGVLILEVVTGQRALANEAVDDDDVHITDRVWRYHSEGRLLECLDPVLITAYSPDGEEHLYAGGDAECLLLLGLACSNPNPSDRPTMPDVVRVIAKSAPPPEVPLERPRFVWPPQEEGHSVTSHGDSVGTSMTSFLESTTTSTCEVPEHVNFGHPTASVHARAAIAPGSFPLEHSIYVKTTSSLVSREMPC